MVVSIRKGAHSRKLCFFCARNRLFLTVLQYIIESFLLLFSFSARNSRTEEHHSVFRQNPFCQQENSDENESNDGLHKKLTLNKNEPIFCPSKLPAKKSMCPFRFTSLNFNTLAFSAVQIYPYLIKYEMWY